MTLEEKARRLIELTGTATLMRQTMEDIIFHFATSAPPEAKGKLRKVRDVLLDSIPKLIEEYIPVYVSMMPENVMDAAIAFWETPEGKQCAELTPKLQEQCRRVGDAWGKLHLIRMLDEDTEQPASDSI